MKLQVLQDEKNKKYPKITCKTSFDKRLTKSFCSSQRCKKTVGNASLAVIVDRIDTRQRIRVTGVHR